MKLPWRRGRAHYRANWLVVGLGNPGERYSTTRHNVGHRVLAGLARKAGVRPRASGRTIAIAVGTLGGESTALVRTRTFMNESGNAVRSALSATRCDLEHTIVVYDDLDLPVGALRLRAGGGHGGNNGLKSIVSQVGKGFIRVRLGIGRPLVGGEPSWEPDEVSHWVLSEPLPDERERLDETISLACDAIECVIAEGLDVAGNRFNRR